MRGVQIENLIISKKNSSKVCRIKKSSYICRKKNEKDMNATQLSNGQYEVKSGNLTLTQTELSGLKINTCEVCHGDWTEQVSANDERFKPLFIALHNFKSGF